MTGNRAKGRSNSTLKALVRKRRHKILTFWRIIKYGISSFSRNAWLSIAATAIMVVTLSVISIALVARNVMNDTVSEFESQVEMSIYVIQDITPQDRVSIERSLDSLSSVKEFKYISSEEARKDFATLYRDDPNAMAALSEATNKMPGIFRIKVENIDDISELENLVNTDETVKASLDPEHDPSFLSEKREAIDNIAKTANFIEKACLIVGAVFVVIASLIIFNTIRMAIFNRREEIYMMKLIGADKSFIRGPFIVEAVQYGLMASIITASLIAGALAGLGDRLSDYGVIVQPTVDLLAVYWPIAVIGLMFVGTIIGVISSLLATRKYLKLLQ
jgi:Cell division protein